MTMDMEQAKRIFAQDRFAKHAGIEIVEVGKGYSKARMPIDKDKHFNSANVVHGGAIFTLADFAFAVASNSHGQLALAINVNISFIKAKEEGCLYAEATEVTEPTRLGIYDVTVTDEEERLIARFHGMVYRKQEKVPGL